VALLDLDGSSTSATPRFPRAQALAKAADAGMRLAYVTNNSSRTPSRCRADRQLRVAHGRRRGHSASRATLLAGRLAPARPCWWWAATGCAPRSGNGVPAGQHRPGPACGRGRGFAPASLFAAGARVPWRSRPGPGTWPPTRRDMPTGAGGSGQRRALPGDRPLHRPAAGVAGKPEPPLHAEAVARTGARHPLVSGTAWTRHRGRGPGRRASLLVFTGVTRLEDVVLAGPDRRPTTWPPTWPACSPAPAHRG